MMRGLCCGSFNPFSACMSSPDDAADKSAERAAGKPAWEATHQSSAEEILTAARHRPLHAPVAPCFDSAPISAADRHGGVLQSRLSLAPDLLRGGQRLPVGPQFLLLSCPGQEGAGLWELARVLRDHDVKHLLTLGDLRVPWLPDGSSVRDLCFRTRHGGVQLCLWSSAPQQRSETAWASALMMSEQTDPMPDESPARKTAADHPIGRFQVVSPTPGLLDPIALRSLEGWLRTEVPPGAPVGVIGQSASLHAMAGQLALLLSMLRQAPEGNARGAHALQERTRVMTEAASGLQALDPRYLAQPAHLSAVLAAHQDLSESLPTKSHPAQYGASHETLQFGSELSLASVQNELQRMMSNRLAREFQQLQAASRAASREEGLAAPQIDGPVADPFDESDNSFEWSSDSEWSIDFTASRTAQA